MLPRVKIDFMNGALGSTAPNADGVSGLVLTGAAVDGEDKFKLNHGYLLKRFDNLEQLGITAENNACIYKHVSEFYAQAGDGAELWLMGVASTVKPSQMVLRTNPYAAQLLRLAGGRIRTLAVSYAPAANYSATLKNGVDADVLTAAANAQQLAEWATEQLYAPVTVLLAAWPYSKAHLTSMLDASTLGYNRVGLVVGDTVLNSKEAALGLVLGRIARNNVEVSISRVRDGQLAKPVLYLGDEEANNDAAETLHDKGYITFRTYTGKAGYFVSDDGLATGYADDYRYLTRRRCADKAYRTIYSILLDYVGMELPLDANGKLSAATAKSIELEVEAGLSKQMGSALSATAEDSGVVCYIDPEQDIAATSTLNVSVKLRPLGYSKYIDVELGFTTKTDE